MRAASLVSVVIPAFNEAGALESLVAGVREGLRGRSLEIVFVNDGSTDTTAAVLDQLATTDPAVKVVHLSRNFGHQAALFARLTNPAVDTRGFPS